MIRLSARDLKLIEVLLNTERRCIMSNNSKEIKGIKKMFIIAKTKILFYVIIYMLIYSITRILLNQFNLEYRQWVNFVTSVILLFGGSAGIIQILRKKDISLIMIVFLEIILVLIIIGGSFFVIISLKFETTAYKDGRKMIQGSPNNIWENFINYYEYKNIFIRGKNVKIKDTYDDYISEEEYMGTEYYDESGKCIDIKGQNKIQNVVIIDKETDNSYKEEDRKLIKSMNPEDVLYEKEINDKVKIRAIYRGAILGQRYLSVIAKTTDNGKTWYNQLEMYDEGLAVNNDAKYVFINENIGFINNLQTVVNNETQKGLLVTIDGGKTFETANFIKPNFIGDSYLYVEDIPYVENGNLKVKTYEINNSVGPYKIYYEFYSKDNGKTWIHVD